MPKHNMATPKLLLIGLIVSLMIMLVSSSIQLEHGDLDGVEEEDDLWAAYEEEAIDDDDDEPDVPSATLRRFLATVTCNKNPKVCRKSGSAGKTCCKKKCVNTKTDSNNCGSCGRKCKSSFSCCSGNCKNLNTDKNNCGSCSNKCKSPKRCRSGVCGYA